MSDLDELELALLEAFGEEAAQIDLRAREESGCDPVEAVRLACSPRESRAELTREAVDR